MNKALALILPAALALLLVLGLFLLSARSERLRLQQKNERLNDQVQQLQGEVRRLAALTNPSASSVMISPASAGANTHSTNPANLVAQREAERGSKPAKPETANQSEGNANPGLTPAPIPQPYQVKAYLGSKYVGLAWVIPSGMKLDEKTGRYQYEPVIRLPEKAREDFTEYVTNVVEKQIPAGPQIYEREVYVEQRPYWMGVPYYVPTRRHRLVDPDSGIRPPAPPGRPQTRPPHADGSGLYVPPKPGDPGFYIPPSQR